MRLNTIHNLHFYLTFLGEMRQALAEERLKDWVKTCYAESISEEESDAGQPDPWRSSFNKKPAGKRIWAPGKTASVK
jgi:hypothetical protein